MTASDRFDQLFAEALTELAGAQHPDYFDDVLDVATRRAQRPAWTFLERWIPMDTATRRTVIAPTFPWRTAGLIVVIIALVVAAAAVAIIGSQPATQPAPPFGPAGNGLVAYAADGDIFVRASHGGPARLVIGTDDVDVLPYFSRDGTHFSFVRLEGDPSSPTDSTSSENLFVATADGTEVREILAAGYLSAFAWSVDGSQMAAIAEVDSTISSLFIINTADGTSRRLETGRVVPLEGVDWRPPKGGELIFRGQVGNTYAIYGIRPDGTGIRQISAGGTEDSFWTHYAITSDGNKLLYGERDTTVDGYSDGRVDLRILDLDTGEDMLWGTALPALTDAGATYTGPQHWGGAVLSPDGKTIAFGRYWAESDGMINHQVFLATLAGNGADAMPVGEPHRSQAGQGPFDYVFSPDGRHLIVQYFDQQVTWLADPTDGSYDTLPWGNVSESPSWQRVAVD